LLILLFVFNLVLLLFPTLIIIILFLLFLLHLFRCCRLLWRMLSVLRDKNMDLFFLCADILLVYNNLLYRLLILSLVFFAF
jgi:hypothetical protein